MKQTTKPSEIFFEAHRKGTRQIIGELTDGKGGYCAEGLLHYTINPKIRVVDDEEIEKLTTAYRKAYCRTISQDNDYNGFTFEDFGRRFAAMGL